MLSVLSQTAYNKANPLVSNTLRIGERAQLKPEWEGSELSCRDINGRVLNRFDSELPTLPTTGIYIITVKKDNQLWVQKITVY